MKRLLPVAAARILALAALAAACAPLPRGAPAVDRGVLIGRLGPDTLLVERFDRSQDRIYVESAVRAPRALFRTLEASLNPDGSLSRIVVATFDPQNARTGIPRDSATVVVSADSTIYTFGIGPNKRFLRLAGRGDLIGSLPGGFWYPNWTLLASRAPQAIGDSLMGTFTGGLGAHPIVIKRLAADTVTVWFQLGGTMRVLLGRDGRAVSLDGTGSSLGYVITRRESIDIDSVVRDFAERERASRPIGALSLWDTTATSIAGARIAVEYGRPSRRGRTIFGNVVAWNQIWRTGANAATQLTTDRALAFGDILIPAGRYTLYTIPTPTGWTLLVSSQTGQWGSAAPDLTRIIARVPMRITAVDAPVEIFTIELEPAAGGGVVRMSWDRTRAEASFAVR